MSKYEQAYQLREQGYSWTEIAERLGLKGSKNTMRGAKAYARRCHLPWPIGSESCPEALPESDTLSAKAYQLRLTDGLQFSDIDVQLGTSKGTAYAMARKYARTRGLKWPLDSTPQRETAARQEQAYWLRMQGLSWPAVGEELGTVSPVTMAKSYADAVGIAWPPPMTTRGEWAYRLRCTGLSWAEVRFRSSFSHTPHAITGAKRWAVKNNMPWPITWVEPVRGGSEPPHPA